MSEETLANIEQRMQRAVEVMQNELATIRTGRASPGLVEHLKVEYAGAVLPLNQVASVSVPGANLLIIQPWDRNSISGIEKAIMSSDLGLNPTSDGRVVRVNIPSLTEERRQELVKIVKRRVEDGRVAVRNLRREALDDLRAQEKNKELSQDEQKRAQAQLQKLTDGYVAESSMAARRSAMKKFDLLPTHVAMVPDGNGRWAERRGLPRLYGHRAGADNMHRMVQYLNEYPVSYLTLYGFSSENWVRPQAEVSGLFDLLLYFIENYLPEIDAKDIRLRHVGRLNELPDKLQEAIAHAVATTQDNTRMTLNVAFNYGGRPEIVDAARRIVADGLRPEDIDEEAFSNYLYTAGSPDVDLLIRTGDETRLSNFLLWQAAYSEYHFTKVLWPDFRKRDLDRALLSYSKRVRRFGGL